MPDTVQLLDPEGQPRDVPFAAAAGLLTSGWRSPTPADTLLQADQAAAEQDYGGASGAAKAAAYGLLRGGTLTLSDVGFRALGADARDLKGYQRQNPGVSIGAEILGGLAPALAAPGTLLARTPTGAVSGIGRSIVQSAEGAGSLARAGAAAAGAAIEGGIYGGGQYLSQVALEDKPLAAEGFLGAMGKGALWGAPIGGALSLAGDTLVRAKSLFPRSEVTKQAAQAVDREATDALSRSIRDGDEMLEIARQRIAQVDAQAGSAASAERASRAMFGAADPATAINQVGADVDKAKLTEVVDRYTQTKAHLEDWIRSEADPDLEAALLRVRSPDLQVGGPKLRVSEFGEVVPPTPARPDLGEFGLERTSVGKRVAKGTPGPHEPPRLPITEDLPPLPLGDPAPAPIRQDVTSVVRKRAVAGGGSPVEPPVPVAPPAPTAPARSAALDLSAPVDRLSLRQIDEYQSLLNDAFDNAAEGTPAYRALSDKWDAAVSRRLAIKDGKIAEPVDWVAGSAPAAGADDSLEALLAGTKQRLDAGEDFRSIGKPGPAAAAPMSEDAFTAYQASFSDAISDAERSAATAYSGGSHRGINRSLRTGEKLSELNAKRLEHLDSMIARSSSPNDVTVLRGENNKERFGSLAKLKPGDVYTDKGYLSTTAGSKIDDAFVGDVEMHIVVPKGSQAAPLPSLKAGERELLLPRNNRYRVESSEIGPDPGRKGHQRITIKVTSLGPEGAPPVAIGDDVLAMRPGAAAPAAPSDPDSLEALLLGTKQKLDAGESFKGIGAPARAAYAAEKAERTAEAAKHFRALARGEAAADPAATSGILAVDQAPARVTAKTIVDRAIRPAMAEVVTEDAIAKALRKHAGKNVDVGSDLRRAAKAIGDHEAALADLTEAVGPSAPQAAKDYAQAFRAAVAAQADASAVSAARAASDIGSKVRPAIDSNATTVEPNILAALRRAEAKDAKAAARAVDALAKESPVASAGVSTPKRRGALGVAADVGTALEVLQAMGVHVPDVGSIPVIGPVLSLYLKARAVLGILGRRGGSIGSTAESVMASKSSAVRDRINSATRSLLDVGAKVTRKAQPVAGTAGALAYKLFPGSGDTKSNDPATLYRARMDELVRAQAPGAVEAAIADRFRTSDPSLQDAVTVQARRAIQFLYEKAPKESLLQSMIPGDGKWHPSKARLSQWSRYVAAVNDPAGVLEDLSNGHVTMEGAEALRVVYPALYAEAQRTLLEHAPQMQRTLPYHRRVSISIMFRVPVDGTMTPRHMQFLQPAAEQQPQPGAQPMGAPPPPMAPAISAPLDIGQQTMTSLQRREGM